MEVGGGSKGEVAAFLGRMVRTSIATNDRHSEEQREIKEQKVNVKSEDRVEIFGMIAGNLEPMSAGKILGICARRFWSGQPFTANHALTYAILQMDARLRRRQHIFEFCNHPRCLLRLALRRVGDDFELPAGLSLPRGAGVGELHLWNEHIPPIPAEGPNFVWATTIRRQMRESLALLAESARDDFRLRDVAMFGAKTGLGGDKPRAHFERLMKSFGFERVEELTRADWRERLVGLGESLHQWALLHAFNPMALMDHRLIQLSFHQLWMSRETLLEKYPPGARGFATLLTVNECGVSDRRPVGVPPPTSETALA
jgi:hypothetical protein